MSTKTPLGTLKQFLGYLATPECQEASSEALKAIGNDALLKQDDTQENFTTGISAAGTAAAAIQNAMPPIFADVQTLLNSKGLTMQVSQVVVTNVVVLKQSPTETRSISLVFDGELTQENADNVRRRACMELA